MFFFSEATATSLVSLLVALIFSIMLHAGCRIRVLFQPSEWPHFYLNVITKTTHRIYQS